MSTDKRLETRFWGVRGSTPTPRAENLGYGGNTACVEVRQDGRLLLIIDAGTGIHELYRSWKRDSPHDPFVATIFLTHFHWDHIQGIPLMAALYDRGTELTFCSDRPAQELRRILEAQMANPYFPVEMTEVQAKLRFEQVDPEGTQLGDAAIQPFPLWHPGNAVGYRITTDTSCLVHASDYEHGNREHDRILVENSAGAETLIYDAQFTPEEYKRREGWGHSTWLAGARIAKEAGVERLLLFHHDPDHDDTAMEEIETEAKREFENTEAAREGSAAKVSVTV